MGANDFVYPFGIANQLVYLAIDGQTVLFDGARGKLYRDLPDDLRGSLEAMRGGVAPGPGADGWAKRLQTWADDRDSLERAVAQPALQAATSDSHPAFYVIYPTATCNLNCGYCFNDRGTYGGTDRLMSMETARATLEYLKGVWKGSDRREVQVTLLGGEPLLNKEVARFFCEELLALNGEEGYPAVNIVIDTNGLPLVDSPLLPLLGRYGRQVLVELSIDGAADRHNRQRPQTSGLGSHSKALKALRQLREYGINVRVGSVVPQPYEMVAVAEELLDLGVEDFYLAQLEVHQFGTGMHHDQHFDNWANAYRDYAVWAVRQHQAGREFTCDLDRTRAQMLKALRKPVSPYSCTAGRRIMGISADGQFSPCDRFFHLPEYTMGDVFSGLDSESKRDWQDKLTLKGIPILTDDQCSQCYARWRCRGGCYARQADLDGAMGMIDRGECRYTRYKYIVDLWYAAQDVPECEVG